MFFKVSRTIRYIVMGLWRGFMWYQCEKYAMKLSLNTNLLILKWVFVGVQSFVGMVENIELVIAEVLYTMGFSWKV